MAIDRVPSGRAADFPTRSLAMRFLLYNLERSLSGSKRRVRTADAFFRPIMRNTEKRARPSPDAAREPKSGSEARHRVFLLECRLEQMRANVDEARAEAHRARALLAEANAREADHAHRYQLLHEELAAAREELGLLHRRLEHSEALRAGLEGRLFESNTPEDARELVRLRSELAAARDLTVARQRTMTDLRARVEGLVTSRETLLCRVTEWQCAVREGDVEAIDLAEFIAALSHDVLELEHRSVMAERREAELQQQLQQAGTRGDLDRSSRDPHAAESDAPPADLPATDTAPAAADGGAARLAETADAESRIDTLLSLGRSGAAEAYQAIHPWLAAAEPKVRAAAYQALGHLLEHDPSRLEPHILRGIADADPRVRRRVVLAAATARGLSLARLLDPLKCDPDSQVRRVVHEVLRRTAPESSDADDTDAAAPVQVRSGVAS